MKNENGFPSLLERFFTQRLSAQRRVSPHTIASYRDTFRLLLQFVEKRVHKPPSRLALTDLDPSLIGAFLDELERGRGNSARSRNLRLTAIRSFYRYAAHEEPAQSGLIQQGLVAVVAMVSIFRLVFRWGDKSRSPYREAAKIAPMATTAVRTARPWATLEAA